MMLFGVLLASAGVVSAQATRTWVSGVGDDANPCSRTAPCKTFAGAISKTAARGKINVLDPGGFGGVTITKSITIEAEGDPAGVLVSGTNAIIINAGVADSVTLRNLKLEGIGTGLNGVRILSAGNVLIDGLVIEDFADNLVLLDSTAGTPKVVIRNSVLRRGGTGAFEALVRITPATGVTADLTVENSTLIGTSNGIMIGGTVDFSVRGTSITGGAGDGIALFSATTARTGVLDDVLISDFDGSGIIVSGANSLIRVANSTISLNSSGVDASSGGQILSFGNNRLAGNGTNGTFSGTVGLQ